MHESRLIIFDTGSTFSEVFSELHYFIFTLDVSYQAGKCGCKVRLYVNSRNRCCSGRTTWEVGIFWVLWTHMSWLQETTWGFISCSVWSRGFILSALQGCWGLLVWPAESSPETSPARLILLGIEKIPQLRNGSICRNTGWADSPINLEWRWRIPRLYDQEGLSRN